MTILHPVLKFQVTNSKKVTTKDKAVKSNDTISKPPKIKKEKTSAPREKSVKKSPTKNKGNENSDSAQTPIPGICEENVIKPKPISKSKDKDLNDRVKNRIKLMLSSGSSSDIPFVGKDLRFPPGSYSRQTIQNRSYELTRKICPVYVQSNQLVLG